MHIKGPLIPDKGGSGKFDRFVAGLGWAVFWSVINAVCVWLSLSRRLKGVGTGRPSGSGAQAIKIAFCENGAGYGGAAISLVAFLEKIPCDFKPYIYTSLATTPYQELSRVGSWRHMPAVSLISAASLKKSGIPFASALDNLFNLLPSAMRYYFAFRRDQIQYVYLNNDASCNFAAALAAKMAGLPRLLHARGFNSDTKGNRWVLRSLDHCIAVSHAVKDELLTLGLKPEKCTVVPEGLDLTLFYPRLPSAFVREELGLKDNEPVITLVGGLVDWKGQDVLLDAAPLIFDRFPTAHILLVGGAYGKDDNYANTISQRARAPEFQSRVHLLGTRNDIADILTCSDVVVHASTKPEPFGRTFLEGMALGKAVIASNEGGPLDVITHEFDGLLIEPRDPLKLADAVSLLLQDKQFSYTLGKNAAVKARSYAIENHAHAICVILNETAMSRVADTGYSNLDRDDREMTRSDLNLPHHSLGQSDVSRPESDDVRS